MSMKERPRERKEEKKENSEDLNTINDWLDKVNPEKIEKTEKNDISGEENLLTQSSKSIVTPKVENESLTKDLLKEDPVDIFIIKLPVWVKKPWMYVKPSHELQLSSWLDSWKGLLLEFSRSYKIHIVNISQLNTRYPFSNQEIGKTLTYDQLQFIIDHMVFEGLAKWIDDDKISARIYYHTDEEWAKKIIAYLVESGYAAEVMTFFELQKLKQEWSTLPRDELRLIFEILVNNGRAKWVGEGRDTLSFIL